MMFDTAEAAQEYIDQTPNATTWVGSKVAGDGIGPQNKPTPSWSFFTCDWRFHDQYAGSKLDCVN